MRNIIIRICHWLLAAMGLAGAFACDGGGLSFIGRDEYGTPHCTYEVKCRVVDSESAKIVNGITLTPGFIYHRTDGNGNEVEEFYGFEDALQHEDGTYSMVGTRHAGDGDFNEIHIRMNDNDPHSDGHYKDSTYVVPLTQKDKKGDGNWHFGTFVADVTLEADQIIIK